MAVRRSKPDPNPHNLGDRGLELFKAIAEGRTLTTPEVVNLVEACRLADRLERFDQIILGDKDAWFELELNSDGSVVKVVVSDVVRQARMHASTLKALLAGFESSKAAAGEEEPSGEVPSNVTSIKDKVTRPARRPASRSKRSAV